MLNEKLVVELKIMIHCTYENNHSAQLRHVTVDAIVIRDDQLLLVKRAPQTIEAGKFALPGGFLERDETVEQGILREVAEETGYRGSILNLLRIKTSPNRKGDDRQNIDFVFVVEVIDKVGQHDHEVTETIWYPIHKLPSEDEIAFDHFESIQLYCQYLEEQFPLPMVE